MMMLYLVCTFICISALVGDSAAWISPKDCPEDEPECPTDECWGFCDESTGKWEFYNRKLPSKKCKRENLPYGKLCGCNDVIGKYVCLKIGDKRAKGNKRCIQTFYFKRVWKSYQKKVKRGHQRKIMQRMRYTKEIPYRF